MKSRTREKTIRSVVGIVASMVLLFSAGITLPVVDSSTDGYFQQAITKAGLAYATCRTINASVSIVQNSSLQLEPAGIGLSLAVGQALDPIDDMTERLSDVMVTAITSLGVQKLAYEIGVAFVPPILGVLLLGLSILMWVDHQRAASLRGYLFQVLLLIAVFRFCLPVSSLACAYVQDHFFDARITDARQQLALGSAELDRLSDLSLPEVNGVLGTIENSAAFLKLKSAAFKDVMIYTVDHMGRIIDNLLNLTFLYVGIFLLQVLLLPLLSFWVLIRVAHSLFR
jgi:hypothetical protein